MQFFLMYNHAVLQLIVIVSAITGFLVAYHIHKKKKQPKPFVCPLNFDCHAVVHSDYSKLFGIPLEYIGMFYYATVVISHIIFLVVPELVVPLYAEGVLVVTVVAFSFSLYLTGIQAFKLKQWCTYCLFSALLCTIIFAAVLGIRLL